MTGTWHDARTDFPRDGVQVLCVKQNKAGNRNLCFGSHWSVRKYDNGWITSGGCNNIIAWMTLPEVPEGEIKGRHTVQDPEGELKDCVNELCYQCGQYKHEHEGACAGCRWLPVRRGR